MSDIETQSTETKTEPAAGFQEAAEKARELAEDIVGTRRIANDAEVEQPEWVSKLSEREVGGTQAAEGGSTFDSTADISTGRAENVGITTEAPNRDLPPQPQGRDTESNAPEA